MGDAYSRTDDPRVGPRASEPGRCRINGRATGGGRRSGTDGAQPATGTGSRREKVRENVRKRPRPAAKPVPKVTRSRGSRGGIERSWMKASKSARCAVVVAVGEWDEGGADLTIGQAAVGGQSRARAAKSGTAETARVLAALGHPMRLRIMRKLLDGPATYAALRKLTRLAAGPLYHHVATLRLAGMLMPKERDLYELTRGGRNMILLALTLPSVGRDRRRRPVGVG